MRINFLVPNLSIEKNESKFFHKNYPKTGQNSPKTTPRITLSIISHVFLKTACKIQAAVGKNCPNLGQMKPNYGRYNQN